MGIAETIAGQKYELVPVDKLREHPRNSNRNEIAPIVESIEANGFFGACVVQKSTGYILAGNHRFRAAKQTGMTTVPVLWVDCDDTTAKRIVVVDNRTARIGKDDPETLLSLLQDVQREASSLLGTGYDDGAVDGLLKSLSRDEFSFVGGFQDEDEDDEPSGEELDVGGSDRPQMVALSILLAQDDFDRWRDTRKANGCKTDSELLLHLLEGA